MCWNIEYLNYIVNTFYTNLSKCGLFEIIHNLAVRIKVHSGELHHARCVQNKICWYVWVIT